MLGMGIGRVTLIVLSMATIFSIGLPSPPATAHGNIDQSFTGPCTAFVGFLGQSGPSGQEFTPTVSNLVGVDLILREPQGGGNAKVNIKTGSVAGSIIGTSNTVPVSGAGDLIVHFDFPITVPLIPGNLFVIDVSSFDTGMEWCTNNTNPYPGGSRIFVIPVPTHDLGFTTYFIDPAVGGTFIPLDKTALLLAGVQSISMWMVPVVVAGVGIGIFVVIRRK